MQVDLMKPTLKAPRTKRLKLKYDEPISNFAFKFNLRRYTEVVMGYTFLAAGTSVPDLISSVAGAHIPPLFSST